MEALYTEPTLYRGRKNRSHKSRVETLKSVLKLKQHLEFISPDISLIFCSFPTRIQQEVPKFDTRERVRQLLRFLPPTNLFASDPSRVL